MSWMFLIFAGLMEVGWAVGLKSLQGFQRPGVLLLTMTCLCLSMWGLTRALEQLPLGTAYAVWVGIGALGTGLVGILFFQEPVNGLRLFFLGLLVVALVGLKLTPVA